MTKKENQNYLFKNLNQVKSKGLGFDIERLDKHTNSNTNFKINNSYTIKKNELAKNRVETSQPRFLIDKARKSSYENTLKLK